jgi:hypothetical protein
MVIRAAHAGVVGALAVGVLVQYAGVAAAVLTLTGWTLAVALAAWAARGFRELPELPSG